MKSINTNSSQLDDDFAKLQAEASFANIEVDLPSMVKSKPLDFQDSESELTSILKTREEERDLKAERQANDSNAEISMILEDLDESLNSEDSLDLPEINMNKKKGFYQIEGEKKHFNFEINQQISLEGILRSTFSNPDRKANNCFTQARGNYKLDFFDVPSVDKFISQVVGPKG